MPTSDKDMGSIQQGQKKDARKVSSHLMSVYNAMWRKGQSSSPFAASTSDELEYLFLYHAVQQTVHAYGIIK